MQSRVGRTKSRGRHDVVEGRAECEQLRDLCGGEDLAQLAAGLSVVEGQPRDDEEAVPTLAADVADGAGAEGGGEEAVGDGGEGVPGEGEVVEGAVEAEGLGEGRGAGVGDSVEAQVEGLEPARRREDIPPSRP